MWRLSILGETWINHCVYALHTSCLTPEEHFAYFQLENLFFSSFFLFKIKRMLHLKVGKVWMLAVICAETSGKCPDHCGLHQCMF